MMEGIFPFVSWLERYKRSSPFGEIVFGNPQGAGLGDGGRTAWTEWVFSAEWSASIEINTGLEGTVYDRSGTTSSININLDVHGHIFGDGIGTFPLTSWLETYQATTSGSGILSLGDPQGAGLGEGGQETWTEWIFGRAPPSSIVYISAKAIGTLYAHNETAAVAIDTTLKGELLPFRAGVFPIVSWLEFYRNNTDGSGTLSLGNIQEAGLGDGSSELWNEWIFGKLRSIDSDIKTSLSVSGELMLGLGQAIITITTRLRDCKNGLLEVLGNCWNPYDTTDSYWDFTDAYLTAERTTTVPGYVHGTVCHSWGKWYFEVTVVYVYSSPSYGLASKDFSYDEFGFAGSGWYHEIIGSTTGVLKQYVNNVRTSLDWVEVSGTIGVAVDLDDGKIYFRKAGSWYNSGDPELGTNPTFTFSPIPDHLYPHLQITDNTLGASTLNVGASSFSYTIPTGFKAWDEAETLPVGRSSVTFTLTGVLIPNTTYITANIGMLLTIYSFEMVAIEDFYSYLDITVSLTAELGVESIWLSSTVNITISCEAIELVEQPAYSIAATLTISLDGDLIGTKDMYGTINVSVAVSGTVSNKLNWLRAHNSPYLVTVCRTHRSFYSCELQYNSQVSGWCVCGMSIHQSSYEVDIPTEAYVSHLSPYNAQQTDAYSSHLSPYRSTSVIYESHLSPYNAQQTDAYSSHLSPYNAQQTDAYSSHLSPYRSTSVIYESHLSPYNVTLLEYQSQESPYKVTTNDLRSQISRYGVTLTITGNFRSHSSKYRVINSAPILIDDLIYIST